MNPAPPLTVGPLYQLAVRPSVIAALPSRRCVEQGGAG